MKKFTITPRKVSFSKNSHISTLNRSPLHLDPLEVTRKAFQIVYQPPNIFHFPNKVLILFKKYKRIIGESVCNTLANVVNFPKPNCKKNQL